MEWNGMERERQCGDGMERERQCGDGMERERQCGDGIERCGLFIATTRHKVMQQYILIRIFDFTCQNSVFVHSAQYIWRRI